jgi:hypothetical protein
MRGLKIALTSAGPKDSEIRGNCSCSSSSIMRLSVEILDYIFSFLVDEYSTLSSCSDDPVLSPIVERYVYRKIVVRFIDFTPHLAMFFTPDRLFKLLSENPRVRNHVRSLYFLSLRPMRRFAPLPNYWFYFRTWNSSKSPQEAVGGLMSFEPH